MSELTKEIMDNFEEEINKEETNEVTETKENEEEEVGIGALIVAGALVGLAGYGAYKLTGYAWKGVKRIGGKAKEKFNEMKESKKAADSVETGRGTEEEKPADFRQIDPEEETVKEA